MVKKLKVFLLAVTAAIALSACTVDLPGLFASADMSERWKARDIFHFDNSNLTLGTTYSFIVVSDTHIENGNDFSFNELKDVITADPRVKFVVATGDITQNGARVDIERFITIAKFFGVPCYPVAGNHDVYFGNFPIWKELIGSTCYKIDSDSTTLFILDSANGHFGKKQLDWLESGLLTAGGKKVFVFTHSNLFVKSMFDLMQFTDTRERARFVSMLEGRCSGVFTGPLHKRVETVAAGVQYLSIEDMRVNKMYCRVDVTPQGVSWTVKKLD
jgi:predicted phosphodiesterase